jgi:hypothetical protein
MRKLSPYAAAILTLALAACSSSKKVGEACEKPGSTDECESGGVCSKDSTNAVLCLKICSSQADCAATQECNGVEGSSLKGCRTKK